VAMLVAEDDHSHDFVETVMSNRGYKTRLFRDLEEALKYLEETE
jgi:DNA-binding response OmpR family regulator